MVNACIQRKKFCGHLIQCMVDIPDESVELQSITKLKQEDGRPVGCSGIHWVWTILKAQEGNLNLYLRNNDWVSK